MSVLGAFRPMLIIFVLSIFSYRMFCAILILNTVIQCENATGAQKHVQVLVICIGPETKTIPADEVPPGGHAQRKPPSVFSLMCQ